MRYHWKPLNYLWNDRRQLCKCLLRKNVLAISKESLEFLQSAGAIEWWNDGSMRRMVWQECTNFHASSENDAHVPTTTYSRVFCRYGDETLSRIAEVLLTTLQTCIHQSFESHACDSTNSPSTHLKYYTCCDSQNFVRHSPPYAFFVQILRLIVLAVELCQPCSRTLDRTFTSAADNSI